MKLLTLALVAITCLPAVMAQTTPHKRVLFFSKASSWEQKIVHRDGAELSYIEKIVQKLGLDNGIDFAFSKDGTIFTPENIASFDAFFFFTSGDMTHEDRTGRGDNFPLMTLEGKRAFLDAIRDGKGFVGCNTANYTFTEAVSPGEKNDPEHAWRYTKMIGSGYMGHNEIQKGYFSYLDRRFPGFEKVPADYTPVDQWYAFNRLMPDIHVLMAIDSGKLVGNLYERQPYPVAWTRMEGKGRVFYTTMGHTPEIWQDPVFMQMLLGGIRWATRLVDANVNPDIAKVTPGYNEIPPHASKFIASNPPVDNPHFPEFKVWLDAPPGGAKPYPMTGGKRVLFFTKSAGYEHPMLYRDSAWPSPLEKEMLDFGQANNIDFIFSKDGTIFTPEKIAGFDAFLFYTSGDPSDQPRNGLGDNYKLMSGDGKELLLQAIRNGKGFIGVHSALDTFPGYGPYAGMLGSERQTVEWSRMEGKGRVYYTTLGHSEETWKDPAFRRALLAAIHWTTGITPVLTIPTR